MDNVTHSLAALVLARAGLDRYCPRATLLLLLSSNAPDIDIVMLARGQLAYLEAHRGYTHSFLFLPVMALACVVVTAVVPGKRLPWIKAWLLAILGIACHLLLDWTNSYGIRPLIPFSSRWFYLDLNGLYDVVLLVVLLFAVLWPLLSRLVSSEIGARTHTGRGLAIFVLVFFVLYDAGRAILHARVLDQLEARLYDGMPPISVAALPSAFSPLNWRGVVETTGAFRTIPVNAIAQVEAEDVLVYFKPAETSAIENARRTEPFRYFLYFARFPVWSQQPVARKEGEGIRVELTDLRFGTPGAGAFHCIAFADTSGRVLQTS
jgi:inner membrane protein